MQVAAWFPRHGVRDPADGLGVLWTVISGLALVLLLAILLRRRVELRGQELRHRNLARWQTIAAPEIQAVTVTGDSINATLRIWTADRRPHACVALSPADLNVIGDWWLAQRGQDWRPLWGVTPSGQPLFES